MEDFIKIINPGKALCGNRGYNLFCQIVFANGSLTISGVVGPTKAGNSHGGAGQVTDYDLCSFSEGWSESLSAKFRSIWKEWGNNDLTAGSPRQMSFLSGKNTKSYEEAVDLLKQAGLYEDTEFLWNGKPYIYGSAWLTRIVPDEVLQFLHNLPDTKITPAWV